jgi:NADH-quinone oxidoreductase subunit J
MWLALPRRSLRGRLWGVAAALAGLGFLGAELSLRTAPLAHPVLAGLSLLTVVACGAAVVARDPVYAAVRFALALLGVAGLLMYQGAQFLGVATLAVYAGAILVTFLFVLMLAEPWGNSAGDLLSWAPLASALSGALVAGVVVGVLLRWSDESAAIERTAAMPAVELLTSEGPHVARLGARLFGRHVLSVELAGVILLAALVGAVAVVERGRQRLSQVQGTAGAGDWSDSSKGAKGVGAVGQAGRAERGEELFSAVHRRRDGN